MAPLLYRAAIIKQNAAMTFVLTLVVLSLTVFHMR